MAHSAPPPAPDRIRLTFLDASATPAAPSTFITIIGRDSAGRFCHLESSGAFIPCAAADNTVPSNGEGHAYAMPLQGSEFHLDLDRKLRMDSARAYISVGGPLRLRMDAATGALVQPDPGNRDDPNAQLSYDWIEFALDASGFHGNTTCVDQFGLPVTLAVTEREHPNQPLGPVGIQKTRSAILRAWKATVPEPFQGLLEPDGLRILAPIHSRSFATGGFSSYFEPSILSLWAKHKTTPLILTPDEGVFTGRVEADARLVFTREGDPGRYVIKGRPSSTEVFACGGVLARGSGLEKVLGAQLAALLNRNIEDPLAWRSAAGYYRQPPCNVYARFWHQHSLDGKAYGFPYDDVNDQSSSLASQDPMEITVTFRWD